MPSSVKDRFTADFDYLFFFTKSKKYWFERQRETLVQNSDAAHSQRGRVNKAHSAKRQFQKDFPTAFASAGRNKRSVWRIPSKPFPEAHFATFPEALCETPILAGCPEFICLKCGKPREKLYEGRSSGAFNIRVRDVQKGRLKHTDRKASKVEVSSYDEQGYAGAGKRFIGYTDCGCNAGWKPGVVLDPFFGSGTVGVTALKSNRHFIGIEMNADYIRIAEKRLRSLATGSNVTPVEFGAQTPDAKLREAA